MLTFGSLFAGIGGFDLGFERAGMRCAWQVEIDPFCRKVLAKHWSDVRRWDDVRTFPPEPIDGWRVDVICGGFPCKQTSTAAAIHGKRNGLDGTDSGLWYGMLRVVQLLRPRWVVVENVAGAATWSREIARGLAVAGYQLPDKPTCLPAACFGAIHRRRRLFWIADLDGKGLEIAWQPEPPSSVCIPRGTADGNPWLSSLPGVLRVADGVPGRVDRRRRIERLGNSVVPQVAQWIGRRIVEAATCERS